MGFFLTDIVNSALTPKGTNARRKQEQGQQDIGNLGGDIARSSGADYLNAMKFGRGFDPQMQNNLRYLSNSMSTSGLRDQAIAAARANRAQILSQQSAPSLNAYANQGVRAAGLNSAQDAENRALNNAYSPQAHAQAAQNFAQALGAYKNNYANDFKLGAGAAYGQPQVQIRPGLLDYAGKALDLYSGFKNALGTPSKTDGDNE